MRLILHCRLAGLAIPLALLLALFLAGCTQETQNRIGRSIQNWTGTDGVLEIYAGEKLVKGRVPIFPARFLSDRNVKRPSVSTCSTGLLCSMNVTEEWPLHFLDTKRYSPL